MLGVGTTSVKRWADAGLIECIKTPGGHRRFARSVIQALLQEPLRLDGERRGEASEWVDLLVDSVNDTKVDAKLREILQQRGSWWEVADSFGPVLEEIGQRWNTGGLSVLQEHLASERLARALTVAAREIQVPDGAPIALLLAAEGEEHTLGLSLVELCLRSTGWDCRWVGRNTPFSDVREYVETHPVNLVAVSASSCSSDQSGLADQAARFGEMCRKRGARLLLGGRGRWPEAPAYGERVRTFAELRDLLERE